MTLSSIKRILIANRGEIARRINRTCQRLGIETVAVYSDKDRQLPHLRETDLSLRIGHSLAYLEPETIVQAALDSNSDAIHPGYGFLSENAQLAKLCEENKLNFIGPSSKTLKLFGDKLKTRELATKNKVSIPKGLELRNGVSSQELAESIGLPLMIKAAHGGGGKGMRLVRKIEELDDSIVSARREAEKAFASSELIAERAILNARHIEVQVIGDGKNCCHLFDRDCSLQRRHQKIIEIAPAEGLSKKLREKLFKDSVVLGKAASLRGLATVEFLVDSESEDYFLLEVNPRIQVEHPVTELLCELDLVEEHLKVATGESLKLDPSKISPSTVAIELRICAENPVGNLLPQTGLITNLSLPTESKNLRIDHNLCQSLRIGGDYDSLLCKMIAVEESREEAARSLLAALKETEISGLQTNIPLLQSLLNLYLDQSSHPTTRFLEENFENLSPSPSLSLEEVLAFAGALREHSLSSNSRLNPLSLSGPVAHNLTVNSCVGSEKDRVSVEDSGKEAFQVKVGTKDEMKIAFLEIQANRDLKGKAKLNSKQFSFSTRVESINGLELDLNIEGFRYLISPTPATRIGQLSSQSEVVSPLPGSIVEVRVKKGEKVEKGQVLVLLESMKMEHPVIASYDGLVTAVEVSEGQTVEMGTKLIEVDPGS